MIPALPRLRGPAMRSNITEPAALHSQAATKFGKQRRTPNFFTTGLTKFEAGVCDRVRSFIEDMIETKLETAPSRPRYGRSAKARDETDNVVRQASAGIGTAIGSRSLMAQMPEVQGAIIWQDAAAKKQRKGRIAST